MTEYTYELVEDLDEFDDLIINHPLQCSAFAKFYALQHNCVRGLLRVYNGGVLCGVLLFFLKGKGAETISGFPGGKLVNHFTQYFLPELIWYSGPTFFGEVNKEELTSYMIHVLGRAYNTKKITADLPFLYGNQKWATYKVNLEKEEMTLWERIEKGARKNIKKTMNLVDVRFGNDKKMIEDYLKLLKESRKHLSFLYLPPVHVNELLVSFFKDKAQVCIVYERTTSQPVAAMGLITWGDECVEVGSAIGIACKLKKLYCGDLIKWEIIRYAKNKGLKWYDLGGCSPSPSTDKEKSIRRFKEKFGGEYVEYGVLR